MNLFSKYNRISLLTTIAIFLLAIGAFALLIQSVIIHQLDEDLRIRQKEITTYTLKHARLPDIIPVGDQLIHYSLIQSPGSFKKFRTVELYDSVEQVRNDFRELRFNLRVNNQLYQIQVAKSMEESHVFFNSILVITIVTIFLILVTSLLLNRIVLRKIWSPFYVILNALKTFKLGSNEKLLIPKTDINEFQAMSEAVLKSTNLAVKDYHILKEFTENASHEMQTPLAVIQSKIDILSQDEQLTEQQSRVLQSCYNAIQRLSSLSRSLLLLAKIENRQFHDIIAINLKTKTEEKIEEFKELWQVKNFTIESNISECTVEMNPQLADILLNNLFSNATRYTTHNGTIRITLNSTFLEISNTSFIKELSPEKVFHRFYKEDTNNQYTGLGLSILKEICDLYHFDIQYRHNDDMHYFKIEFE